MGVYRVPTNQWTSFTERFSQQHKGEPLTLRHKSNGEEEITRGLFERLELDTSHGDPRLWAFVTEPVGVSRVGIGHAANIVFEQATPEVGGKLLLSSDEGDQLDLVFEQPLVEGELDGLAPGEGDGT